MLHHFKLSYYSLWWKKSPKRTWTDLDAHRSALPRHLGASHRLHMHLEINNLHRMQKENPLYQHFTLAEERLQTLYLTLKSTYKFLASHAGCFSCLQVINPWALHRERNPPLGKLQSWNTAKLAAAKRLIIAVYQLPSRRLTVATPYEVNVTHPRCRAIESWVGRDVGEEWKLKTNIHVELHKWHKCVIMTQTKRRNEEWIVNANQCYHTSGTWSQRQAALIHIMRK